MASNATLAWSNIVAALGAAIVSTLITAWYFRGFPTATGAPPSGASGYIAGLGTLAAETITYIPHILLLFGVLADMFTMEGVYSIPSLIGLFSIPLNYLMKYFWDGLGSIWVSIVSLYSVKPANPFNDAAPKTTEDSTAFSMENPLRTGERGIKRTPRLREQPKKSLETYRSPKLFQGGSIKDYDGCDVQGFESLRNPYAPQTLVITATVFVYYILDLIMNRSWRDATASIVVFAVLYAAESFIIGSCGTDGMSASIKALISFLNGLLFGGTAYGVVSSFYPNSLPSRVLPDFPRKNASDLTQLPDGSYVDENNTPWIVLPNGNAIPAVSEGGLNSLLGGVDETSTSTGAAAVPGSCPSGSSSTVEPEASTLSA